MVIAVSGVATAAVIVLGCVAILAGRGIDLVGLLLVAFIFATLGGLIVVPGAATLVRLARGVPTVRLDPQGIVWGDDRSRDLAIAWPDVAEVRLVVVTNQVVPDRVFVIRARDGVPRPTPATRYGRVVAALNRSQHRTPFAISTMGADQPVERVRAVLASHLPDRPIVDG